MSKNTEQYALNLLDKLIDLDQQTTAAYYEMGRLLTAFKRDKLYTLIGYDSLGALIEEELSFHKTSAAAYMRVYENCCRLKYTKNEALDILNKFGLTHLNQVLPKIKQKIGTRALKARIDSLDEKQVTFWMHEKEWDEVERALVAMGGIKNENGRWMNSSEALIEMARAINGHKKAA